MDKLLQCDWLEPFVSFISDHRSAAIKMFSVAWLIVRISLFCHNKTLSLTCCVFLFMIKRRFSFVCSHAAKWDEFCKKQFSREKHCMTYFGKTNIQAKECYCHNLNSMYIKVYIYGFSWYYQLPKFTSTDIPISLISSQTATDIGPLSVGTQGVGMTLV